MLSMYFFTCCVAICVVFVNARPEFPQRIPNGVLGRSSGIDCEFFGHQGCIPGAPRNEFGLAFKRVGLQWTKELCEEDSDGDGQTNGQELGDPCCQWSQGNDQVLRSTDLSHPGDASNVNTAAPTTCPVASDATPSEEEEDDGDEGDGDGEPVATSLPDSSLVPRVSLSPLPSLTPLPLVPSPAPSRPPSLSPSSSSSVLPPPPPPPPPIPSITPRSSLGPMQTSENGGDDDSEGEMTDDEPMGTEEVIGQPSSSPMRTRKPTKTPSPFISVEAGDGEEEEDGDVVDSESTPSVSTDSPELSPSGSALSVPPLPDGDILPDAPTPTDSEEGGEAEPSGEEIAEGSVDAGDVAGDETDEGDGSVCFPGDATVTLADGSERQMRDIRIGDRVRVGVDKFSHVFMFTHRMPSARHLFITIHARHAASKTVVSVSMTPGHYLYVDGRLMRADRVSQGDLIDIVSVHSKKLVTARVVLVERVHRSTGLYNPQTLHGDVIVNNVRVSTYTHAVQTKTAHSLLAPLRAAFRALRFSTCAFDSGADRLSSFMPKGDEL